SPGSVGAVRAGPDPRRPMTGGRPLLVARRSTLRRLYALVRPTAWLLRLRDLGRADDQLPAAAADAGRPDRRGAPAPDAGADLRQPGDHPRVRDDARRDAQLDLAGLRHVPRPDRALRLRN